MLCEYDFSSVENRVVVCLTCNDDSQAGVFNVYFSVLSAWKCFYLDRTPTGFCEGFI